MAKKEMTLDDLYKRLEANFNAYFEPEKIRTGIIPLDLVLNGYLETGSLIELSGESQTGKSTLLLHLSRVMCEKGKKVVYIDAEGSVKEDQIAGIGLLPYLSTSSKKDNLFTVIKDSGYRSVEQLIDMLINIGGYTLFIIDSITALMGDEYLDVSEAGTDHNRISTENRVGYDALMASRFLKKLNGLKTTHNCIFIFVNQTRVSMNAYGYSSYKPAGGQAVTFYPDVRLYMSLKDKLNDKKQLAIGETDVQIGANTTIKALKSRLGLSYIEYPMTIYFGKGVSILHSYFTLLPNINTKDDSGNDVPVLQKVTSVSYVLHLPSGDYKSTGGINGVLTLLKDHSDEIDKVVDSYLTEFYNNVHTVVSQIDETSEVAVVHVSEEKEQSTDE